MKLIPKKQVGGPLQKVKPMGIPSSSFGISSTQSNTIESPVVGASVVKTPQWSIVTPETLSFKYQKLGLIPKGQTRQQFIKGVTNNPKLLPSNEQFRFNPVLGKFETAAYGGSYQAATEDLNNLQLLKKNPPSGRYTDVGTYIGQKK